MFRARTPLAWKNLTHDKRRLALAIAGIGFAVLLMYMEIGFLNALLNSTVQLVEKLDADLIIVSRAKYALPSEERFPVDRIYQARAHPAVQAFAVYTQSYGAVLREHGHRGYPIRVLAFREDAPVLQIPALESYRGELLRPYTALADSKSRAKYGFPEDDSQWDSYQAELSGQQLSIVGSFALGTDFANHGNLLMTASNFARYFRFRAQGEDPLAMADLGVVQVEAGWSPAEVQQFLQQRIARDVHVFTKSEFIDREMQFWRTNTPVGYIFTVGAVMGFIVGLIVCYQIIHSDITAHLPEFATLKAMGYTNGYFVWLILEESIYLSLFAFVPGAAVSWILYRVLAWKTGLLMAFGLSVSLPILAFTVVMCICSGLLVLRKLMRADPAALY